MKKLILLLIPVLFSCNRIDEQKLHDIQCTALDGTVYPTIELKNAQNVHLYSVHELGNSYAVLNGRMSEYEAQTDNIKFKTKIELNDINNETIAEFMINGHDFATATKMAKQHK